jgi:hypothetical protein
LKKSVPVLILLFTALVVSIYAQNSDAKEPEWKPLPEEIPDFAVEAPDITAEAEFTEPEWKPVTEEMEELVPEEAAETVVKAEPQEPEWKPVSDELPDSIAEAEPQEPEWKPAADVPDVPSTDEKPSKTPPGWERKRFEIGLDVGIGFTNDLLGAGDILQKTININLKDFNDKIGKNGFNFNLEPDFDFFFNVNMGGYWGGGFLFAIDGEINGNIPKSLFTLLAEGNANEHNPEGAFSVSGAIFAELEVEVHGRLKSFDKLKFGLTPGVFFPVVYIPKSAVSYHLNTDDDKLRVSTSGSIDVYTPLSLDTMADPVGSVLHSGGFDISLAGEYALFEAQAWGSLAVGGTIEHIPFVPAILTNKMTVDMTKDIIEAENLLDTIQSGDFSELIDTDDIWKLSYDSANRKIVRPMRVDFYAVYQPFTTDWLTVTPNLGFTVLGPGDPSFNFGLNAQDNVKHIIAFHFGTGYDELIWKHQAGLAFNFRVFELDIDASLRSQDFVQSFQVSGFSVALGLRFGW